MTWLGCEGRCWRMRSPLTVSTVFGVSVISCASRVPVTVTSRRDEVSLSAQARWETEKASAKEAAMGVSCFLFRIDVFRR